MKDKKMITLRLSAAGRKHIENIANRDGITQTSAVEKIICEHERGSSDGAESFMKLFESKYGSSMRKQSFIDENVQVLLSVVNMMSATISKSEIAKIASDYLDKDTIITTTAKDNVKATIAKNKQKHDNRKRI